MHIAIVGSGQLARMMTVAGWRLGCSFSFLAENGENTSCVEGLGDIVQIDHHSTPQALYEALGKPDVVTVEKEHVDIELLKSLQTHCPVHPNPEAIAVTQHRGREKTFLNDIGVPTAGFKVINNKADLQQAVAHMGFPVLVKTCTEGYDGRGQWKLDNTEDLDNLLVDFPALELIVEAFVPFDCEVSIIAARSPSGESQCYPLTENKHRNGILESSIAPAQLPANTLPQAAKDLALTILDKLDYVGVLSIELFVKDDQLLVNELAPRVHNSGHWTQSAGICSQFENHIRGITQQPLGNTDVKTHVAMINLLGQSVSQNVLNQGNVEIHHYNKSIRPNRKVGHINVWNIDRERLLSQVDAIKQVLIEGEQR